MAPLARDGVVQVTVPVIGVVQVQLAGDVTDRKVVCDGSKSSILTFAAALGPALATLTV